MRILILLVGLFVVNVAGAQAGEHPAASNQHVAVVQQVTGALEVVEELKGLGLVKEEDSAFISAKLQGLVDMGMSLGDAKKLVVDVLTQAKIEGLEGKELESKISEVAGVAIGQLESAKSASEHLSAKPKDHPAH